MIERIPQQLLLQPINLLFQKTLSSHRPLCNRLSLHRRTLHPKQIQCVPKRFYASPIPNHPEQKPPLSSEGGENIAPATKPHRNESSQPPFPPPQPHPSASQPRPKRSLRPYIYATIFFLIGASAGKYASVVIAPPPLPNPSTPADVALTETIHGMASKLPLVKDLSSNPNWTSWDAYSTLTAANKQHSVTAGALAGARGLGGYQRIFHNRTTGEFVTVLWIGGALAGWPGVAHGGMLAMVMDESMGRAAIARFPVRTGVTAKLEMIYRAPTVTNAFCVIRATPVDEGSTERKGWVKASLEDLSGKVCVEAKALFVLPKTVDAMKLRSIDMHRLDQGF